MSQASILLLGTYHFASPGLDLVNMEVPDVLLPEYQAQIEEIGDSIARFNPTKVAVEARTTKDEEINELYSQYTQGKHQLTRNEVQQFGFRIASRLEHQRIYAIDDAGIPLPFGPALEYANEHAPDFERNIEQYIESSKTEGQALQKTKTMRQILAHYNSPEQITSDHHFYLDFAPIGAMDSYIGAEFLSTWYNRNIRIYANLLQITEDNDRILVIYGSGHLAILRELITASKHLELVNTLDYL